MADKMEDRRKLAGLLRDLDYEIENDDETGLRIKTGRVHVTVVVYDDGSLSLVCAVAGGDVDLDLQEVNEANSRVRFAKFSVEGGKLVLEADFPFLLNGPAPLENLRKIMGWWRLAMQELSNLVRELVAG